MIKVQICPQVTLFTNVIPGMKLERPRYARHSVDRGTAAMSRTHMKICPVAMQLQKYTTLSDILLPGNIHDLMLS